MADGNKMVDVETEITPAQLVSLHLHSRHYANRAHMLGGGITIPNADLYVKGKIKEAFGKGVSFRLDENGLREINRKMTPELMEYANAVSNYLNGMCKDAINEVSVQLDGYEKVKVQDYFPIKTAPDFVRNEQDDLKFDLTIEGWGSLKERSNGNNPILLEDVTDVLERHKTSTARYAELAIPARNFRKLLNVTGQEHKWSLKKTIKAKWAARRCNILMICLPKCTTRGRDSRTALGG